MKHRFHPGFFLAEAVITSIYVTGCLIAGLALHRFAEMDPVLAGLCASVAAIAIAMGRFLFSQPAKMARIEKKIIGLSDRSRELTTRVETVEEKTLHLTSVLESDNNAHFQALEGRVRGIEDVLSRLETDLAEALMGQPVTPSTAMPPPPDALAFDDVRQALRANRIDMHLQPIVALPQRQVRYYEGYTRLRREDGKIVMPAEFLGAARQAGLLGAIDNLLLFRCVEILARLVDSDRQLGFFCNIAVSSLEDENFFEMFADMMGAHWAHADALTFEISLDEFETRSALCRNNMARLCEMGFRFSIDRADTLSVDLSALQASGVAFMKVGAEKLLRELTPEGERPRSAVFHAMGPHDVLPAFRRHGVHIIADKAEDEKSIIELLEFGIGYGQGHLFGAPRPIRESLWQETTPSPEFMRKIGAA